MLVYTDRLEQTKLSEKLTASLCYISDTTNSRYIYNARRSVVTAHLNYIQPSYVGSLKLTFELI